MRICHVTSSVSRNGAGPFVCLLRLAQCLCELGENIDVLGIKDKDTEKDLPAWKPLEPIVSQSRFPRMFGYAPGLLDAIEAVHPDIIHTHGLWMYNSLAAFRWSQRAGKPRVVTIHGMLEPWAFRHHRWRKRPVWWAWEKRNVETAAVLHATGNQEAENLRALGFKNPIAIIPNGVDVTEQRTRPEKKGLRTVLIVCRIHPIKGLLNLIKAWSILRPDGWQVIIAGPGRNGHISQVKAAIREAGLEGQFNLPGPVYEEAKWELYRQADLFVLPSFSENFGIVVAEALVSAVPVITTKGTPWRDLHEHDCGWWVDIGVEPLVAALKQAMDLSDEERARMGLRGRRLVEQQYSWPKIAAQMADVYKWVLGQSSKPDCVRLD